AADALRPGQPRGSISRHRARPRRRTGRRRCCRRDRDIVTNPASALPLDTGAIASLRRIRAVLRRHAYLLLKSWTRIVSMMYYPTVTMVVWSFVTLYLCTTNNFLKDAPGFFIGAVLDRKS